jgi:exopolyphosphatase
MSLVTHILDHHQDVFTGHPTSPKTLKVKDIVAVGSCATLVAEQFFNVSPSCIDSHIATLLLAPILIDTANFDKTLARGTSRDRDMADKLLATGITHFASADRLFHATQDAKTDISSLNTTDLLRKDYKEWKSGSVSYGMSSLLIPVSEFLGRDPLAGSSIESFYNNQKLDILIIMSVFSRDGSFHRELGMFSQSERLRNFIVEHCKDQVKLQPLETAPMNGWQAFSQGDLSSSRKQLQPLVGSILSKY